MKPENTPPRLLSRLLQWFCNNEYIEELEGDLEESYIHRRKTHSRLNASLWYAKQVFSLLRPSVVGPVSRNRSYLLKNYVFVAARSYRKHATYGAINIISMSVGLACCIVSYLNYQHNNSYDDFHQNKSEIYRINYTQQEEDRVRHYGVTPVPVGISADEIDHVGARVDYNEWSGNIIRGDDFFDMNTAFVSSNFLDVFTFPMYRGSADLKTPQSVVISKELSMKLFKDEGLDNTLRVYFHGEPILLTVTGVFEDIPSNSSIQVDAFVNIENYKPSGLYGWDRIVTSFLVIESSEHVSGIERIINKQALANDPDVAHRSDKSYYLDPLSGMAKRAMNNDVIGPLEIAFPAALDIVPIVLSFLILLLACFTFTNTTIASASSRLKEIGVRKVLGSRKSQIVFQFLMESILICTLAGLLAIPLAQWLAIQYSSLLPFLQIELVMEQNLPFLMFLGVLMLLTGIIAGAYPALFLSRFQPANILKGNLKYRTIKGWTKILLALQFTFAVLTISASIFFVRNASYVQRMELGFDTHNTVVVRFGDEKEVVERLSNVLSASPRIASMTGSVDHVGRRYHSAEVVTEGEQLSLVGLDVGPGYLETNGISLSFGRDFNRDLASDYQESILINETFVDHMGWTNPIGKKVVFQDTISYYVIGVVEDFYFDAFNSPITPLWLRLRSEQEYNYLTIRAEDGHASSLYEEVKLAWRTTFEKEPQDIKPPEYAREEAGIINGIILRVLLFLGGISGIMAIVGFYALVSLNLYSKSKEIGIRRVMGSSVIEVIQTINRDYWWVLLSGIILGSVFSYLLIPVLANELWAFHVSASPIVSVSAMFLMLITCLATVASRVWNASRINPVELLRDE